MKTELARLNEFKVGDHVEWECVSKGWWNRRRGVIVEVVPVMRVPVSRKINNFHYMLMPRNEESYVVAVGNRKDGFWPNVRNLKLIENVHHRKTDT